VAGTRSPATAGTRSLAVLGVLVVLAAPLVALAVLAVTRPSAAHLAHLARTVLPMQLGSSLVATLGAAAGGAALAAGGLACALFDLPGRALLQRLLLVPLLVPPWFVASVYREALGAEGLWCLVLVLAASCAPLVQLLGTAALASLPGEYLETLRTSGHATAGRVARTLLPLSFPALGAAIALGAVLAWADTGAARAMSVPTLTTGLLDQWFGREQPWAGAALGLVLAGVAAAAGILLGSRLERAAGRERGRLAPGTRRLIRLRGWRAAVPWILSLPQLVAGVALPGGLMIAWTAQRAGRVDLSTLAGDSLHTLLLAAVGTVAAALLALPLAHASISSAAPRLARLAEMTSLALFALPPAVLALAVLALAPAAGGSRLATAAHATAIPLAVALALRSCAVFVVATRAAIARQAPAHVDLLRTLGRTNLAAVTTLLGPFVSGPVAAAAAFVFLLSLQDQLLPLVLGPFGLDTVSTRVLQYAQTQRVRDCAVWMSCLALLGAYPLFMLARLAEASARGDRD
jgi:iron(III) transport system permease protein